MKFVKWAFLLVFLLGLASATACRRGPSKATQEEQKKALDDEMKKAIERNKGVQPQ